MSRFVVLLRGVNVGKGNKVPMAGFRTALEDLGHTRVQTLLNSGNAVFSSSRRSARQLASTIGKAVEERFGVVTPVVVKTANELELIVENNPFPPPEAEHSRFVVAFAADAATLQALQGLAALLHPGESFTIGPHAAYLHCAGGILESKAGAAMLGLGGRAITTRNWATVLKLLSLARERAA